MNIPRFAARRVVGWVVAGVLAVAGLAGVGVAFSVYSPTSTAAPAATPSATATGSASPGVPHRRADGRHRGGLGRIAARRALHGEFVVKGKDGKPVTVDVQRGQVTAVSATSVSLKSEDGFTATYVVNGDTRVRVGREKSAISAIKAGQQAWVVASKSGDTATARILVAQTS